MRDAAFYHLYAELPRAGPGEPGDVRWALGLAGTPPGARILDAGCGPGGDLPTLLEHPGARITAVDSHAPFVDSVRAAHPQVTAFAGDMATAEGPFDLIWCAGALYFLGLASGLAAFRPRLAERGAIAFSEPCHFADAPSAEAVAFWQGYPARSEARLRADVEVAGYRILGTRRLSDAAWEAYYRPLEARAAALRPGAPPDLLRVIDEAEAEAALWRRVKAETGYLLIVAVPE
jgi:trans-aconitate methyltransferase